MVKNLPASSGDARDAGSIPGQEDPLKEEMATHSIILAWKIPCTEEADGLQPTGLQRVRHDWACTHTHTYTHSHTHTHKEIQVTWKLISTVFFRGFFSL